MPFLPVASLRRFPIHHLPPSSPACRSRSERRCRRSPDRPARGVVTVANTGDWPGTFGVQVTPRAEAPFIGFGSEAPPVSVVVPTPVPPNR